MASTNHGSELAGRILRREAKVGVLGLGYVGLPLALTFGERGFAVLGFDTDPTKIAALESGECYLSQLIATRLRAVQAAGRFSASSDFAPVADCDALVICVPTPLDGNREPDLSHVTTTAEAIVERLRPGQLVVLESTCYPGTTDELVRGILNRSGLACGTEFFLAYSPEREDPGNPRYEMSSIPKVIGGVDGASAELAEALYRQVVCRTVMVSSARTAEATKLLENIFRAVNIALVNELKVLYEPMGIDVWEVLEAAETKPFGYMRFNPGPGWGGHCIPVDPYYLAWKARQFGETARFIELAGEVNREMPRYVVKKLRQALEEQAKPVRGSRILLLGLAFKRDVADPRESPAFEILHLLLELGAELSYHDPLIAQAPRMRSWPDLPQLDSVPLEPQTVAAQDAVIVVTDHQGVDYDMVARSASLVVDTRGVYRKPLPNVVKA